MLLRAATGALADDAMWNEAQSRAHRHADGDGGCQSLVDHAMTMSHREWFAHHNRREGYRAAWGRHLLEN